MMDASMYNHHDGNHTPDSRQQPLNPPLTANSAGLNDRLNTAYIDIPIEDKSMIASLTRTIVELVGTFVTPRKMLGLLRILKAITLSFLVLTIAADLMYMCLLEIFANDVVRQQAGGSRDFIIRIYGLILAFLAIGVELDLGKVSKHFLGLKGFIPRGMLLFFIATLTKAHPITNSYVSSDSNGSNNNNGDDDGDDDAATDDYTYKIQQEAAELPYSAIAFQQVTASILGVCALAYFGFGLLCFDRFTSKAFLSTKNPLVTTAIPQPNGGNVNMTPTPVYREEGHGDTSSLYSAGESNGDDVM